MASASLSARARARADITAAITDAARRQLGENGAAALSLRAVARELEMASSAVYRYFPSRDELLTALIVQAYDAAADAAERCEASTDRDDPSGRWLALVLGLRDWALDHRHEWALLYGSPVPGYAAPQSTVGPASRVPLMMTRIVCDARGARDARAALPVEHESVPVAVAADMAVAAQALHLDLPPALVARMVRAWTSVIGTISLELFGHLVGSVSDGRAWTTFQARLLATELGLSGEEPARTQPAAPDQHHSRRRP